MNQWPVWKVPQAFVCDATKIRPHLILVCLSLSDITGPYFYEGGLLCIVSTTALALAPTHHALVSSHKSWCVNGFSNQLEIALAFSSR
jgi:hypothetical protein